MKLLLSLVPPDNKYHNLEASLNVKKGLFLRKRPTNTKKWFQQAIRQPSKFERDRLDRESRCRPRRNDAQAQHCRR